MIRTSKTLLLTSLMFLLSTTVHATKEVGNGGNVIVCRDQSSAIRSVEILDYFEVRQEGGKLKLNANLGSYSAMLKDLFQSWKTVAPKRMAQYEKWLSEFEKDAAIYSGVQIPPIEDTGVISIPAGCELTPAAFQRPDSQIMPGVKRYTINKDLWDQMSEIERAGLVLHELVYREGIRAGHPSSFSTRYFNGYLASATPDPLQYALVVQQMPLEWVEFGYGLVIRLGTDAPFQTLSKITKDGFVAGRDYDPENNTYPLSNYQKGTSAGFIGDVTSEHLKIRFKSLSPDAAHQYGMIEISHEKLHLQNLANDPIDNMMVSIDGLQLEFNQLPSTLSFIELTNRKNLLEIEMRAPESHPEALTVNPASSFYVQADGSRIDSISKIMPGTRPTASPPEVLNYGDGFVTSSGDTWIYNSKFGKYLKK